MDGNLSIFSSLSGFCYKWVAKCCVPDRSMSCQLTHPSRIRDLYLDMSWCTWHALWEPSNEELVLKTSSGLLWLCLMTAVIEDVLSHLEDVSHTALGWG